MATQDLISQYNTLIVTTAMKQGVPQVNAKILAAQAAWETGNFTSNNLKKNNNLFGMAVPSRRKSPYVKTGCNVTAPAGEGSFCYARYDNLEDSVKDLIHWANYNSVDWKNVDTPEKYDEWLTTKGYHTADQASYTAGLRKYYDRIKDIVYKKPGATVLALLGLVLIGTGVYFYFKRKKMV